MSKLELPKIGLGTWKLEGQDCVNSVLKGIEIGYRHIDTAQMYWNEEAVGKALSEATIDRNELIIATKVAIWRLGPSKVIRSTKRSLQRLRLDYIDILYVHWPAPLFYNAKKTLKAFSQLVDEGLVKHIGVSNFTPSLLDEARAVCDKPIAVNQIEHHPWLQQRELREYLKTHDIYLVAYSPLAQGKMRSSSEITQIAKKHQCNESQVILAWEMDHGAVPIPKATGENHLRDNYEAINLKLDQEDIQLIDSIKTEKRLVNPPFVRPNWKK